MRVWILPALGFFAIGAMAPQARLGRRVETSTPRQANHAAMGAGLFGFRWPADPGVNLFNARSCDKCHGEPSFGGTHRDPDLMVRMVPDPKDPGGWANYRLFQEVDRKVTRRPEPKEVELRRAMHLYGIGLLEAIPDSAIAALADPADRDKDGISGRSLKIGNTIGRFGWKADVATVMDFSRDAFDTELGVAVFKPGMDEAQMDDNQVRQVALFLRVLDAPAPNLPESDPIMTSGKKLFGELGCAKCHVPTHKTGDSDIKGLANRTISPYTDLLLHDMGPGKAVVEQGPRASRREYRTAPLWGVGRVGGPYWHDASAPDLTSAILKHEGEAMPSRDRFKALGPAQQKTLLDFLGNL
ncbi:MAG: hypothetical protein K1X67_18025 [Fimbriimonadaceae bacterium]|nr:hypothetical protein [Fimbriimonadaceae bacterium]